MNKLRDILAKNPWIGWVIAVLAVGVAVASTTGVFRGEAPDSVEHRSETVTIRCTETGETWTMNRGEFERLLLLQPGKIDPDKGIPSKFADGRLTGVLVNDSEWRNTVSRINQMKSKYE